MRQLQLLVLCCCAYRLLYVQIAHNAPYNCPNVVLKRRAMHSVAERHNICIGTESRLPKCDSAAAIARLLLIDSNMPASADVDMSQRRLGMAE